MAELRHARPSPVVEGLFARPALGFRVSLDDRHRDTTIGEPDRHPQARNASTDDDDPFDHDPHRRARLPEARQVSLTPSRCRDLIIIRPLHD
jgi:hypothetical protein